MLDRGDYWQCAFVIRKGGFAEIQSAGWSFQPDLRRLAPYLGDRVNEINDWKRSACCRSLSIVCAVVLPGPAMYRRLGACDVADRRGRNQSRDSGCDRDRQHSRVAPREGPVSVEALREVQTRREFPVRMTQRLQVFVQNRFLSRCCAAMSACRCRVLNWSGDGDVAAAVARV